MKFQLQLLSYLPTIPIKFDLKHLRLQSVKSSKTKAFQYLHTITQLFYELFKSYYIFVKPNPSISVTYKVFGRALLTATWFCFILQLTFLFYTEEIILLLNSLLIFDLK